MDGSNCELSVMSGCFYLDHVGDVLLTRNQHGLSWKCLDSSDCVRFAIDYVLLSLPQILIRRVSVR